MMFSDLSSKETGSVRLVVNLTCPNSHFIQLHSLLTLQNYSVKKHMYYSKEEEDAEMGRIISQEDVEKEFPMSGMWNAFEIPLTEFFNAAVNGKIEINVCGVVYLGDSIIQHVPLRICDNNNKDFVIDIGKNCIKVS